ncbi:polysaccharide biosynthesis protein [Pseudooceanicola sp. 502str34]|uniref:nucleoside-diphosphate sugar epimerase/dehydratase n=1 Tax=Maritimibacter alkaliphilus TaxID=404236 RepID=UPI001C964D7D|nr:nucleoside-diphosphate sugar epimerase/dehydratase [Maritimibacter alkaliphilus]MBY6090611.1 polysaccharide biosynthesis protein [Maritimibacter alkaliphilus]
MLYDFVIALRPSHKRAFFICMDLVWCLIAFISAKMLVDAALVELDSLRDFSAHLIAALFTTLVLIVLVGLDQMKLVAYEVRGATETLMVACGAGAACALVNLLPGPNLPLVQITIFAMTFLILSVSSRLAMLRFILMLYRKGNARKRVLIYGAGQTGRQLATALATDDAVVPVAFVDDNPRLQSLTVSGLRVYSPVQIRDLVRDKQIDRVVLAMPSVARSVQARIARRLKDIGCEVHALPSFAEMIVKGDMPRNSAPVDMDNLLGRNRLEEELPGVSDAYKGRRILVTGAGGSIGSELCRQLVTCDPEALVMLDHSELALYNIQRELMELVPELKLVPVLGSICEAGLIRDVLETHEIDVVLHAAAYKHLPMVQMNCIEGLRNNIIGTKVVADAAGAAGVERFILVSSDKAVRPSSIMGSTKRMAEQIVQDLATRSKGTRFSMVRFGNVMGSSGSVIPLFEEQISRGGPVTVTHRAVTRYFMTVSEAVRLVLLAGSFARGGDVFVLDMGEPVPIHQVARQMIEGAGHTVKDERNPHGDIEIHITGLRPGEKLHEELLIGSDMLTTPHPKIMRAQEEHLSELEMASAVADLRKAIDTRDGDAGEAVLRKWVEKYSKDRAVINT